MNNKKRFTLPLVFAIVLQIVTGGQAVEAGLSSGFASADNEAATMGLAYVCEDGVEFTFTLNDETHITKAYFEHQRRNGNNDDNDLNRGDGDDGRDNELIKLTLKLPPTISVTVSAELYSEQFFYEDSPNSIVETFDEHDPVPMEELELVADNAFRAVVYSAADSIPEGRGENLKYRWADFGFENSPKPGDVATLKFSTDLGKFDIELEKLDGEFESDFAKNVEKGFALDFLDDYFNTDGDNNTVTLYQFPIEKCQDDAFRDPMPSCLPESVVVYGKSLAWSEEKTNGNDEYVKAFRPPNIIFTPQESDDDESDFNGDATVKVPDSGISDDLRSSTLDLIGHLPRVLLGESYELPNGEIKIVQSPRFPQIDDFEQDSQVTDNVNTISFKLPSEIRPENDGTGVNDDGHAGPHTVSPDGYAYTFIWNDFDKVSEPLQDKVANPLRIGIDTDSSDRYTNYSIWSLDGNRDSNADVANNSKLDAYPKAAVYYNVYRDDTEHVSIIRQLDRFVDGGIDIEDRIVASKYISATESFELPELFATTDISVKAIFVGNEDPTRSITVTVSTTDTENPTNNDRKRSDVQTASSPNIGFSDTEIVGDVSPSLSIWDLDLLNVPAGSHELKLTIESPEGTGDKALLSGIVISYPCLDSEDPATPEPDLVTPEPDPVTPEPGPVTPTVPTVPTDPPPTVPTVPTVPPAISTDPPPTVPTVPIVSPVPTHTPVPPPLTGTDNNSTDGSGNTSSDGNTSAEGQSQQLSSDHTVYLPAINIRP